MGKQLNIKRIKKFVKLRNKQELLQAELKDIEQQLDQLETQIMEDFINAGIQKIEVDNKVVYLHRQIFAGIANGFTRQDVCVALKRAGYMEYVTENFNTNQLSALLRECERQGNLESVLSSLNNTVKLTEKYSVRAVKST